MSDVISNNLLSAVVFMPLVGAVILMLFFKRSEDEADDLGHAAIEVSHGEGELVSTPVNKSNGAQAIRYFSFAWTLITFVLSILLMLKFDSSKTGFQFEKSAMWIKQFNVHYHIGIDGISLLLIMLTTFLSFLCTWFSFNIKIRVKEYMIFLLVLQTAMTGVFCALDLVLFYVFWEAVLIPMYFLIGIWGHERRIYASVKFFLYTFAGSVLMLVGIIFIYMQTKSMNLVELTDSTTTAHYLLTQSGPKMLGYLFASFSLAFMIKVPMFPFHTWLPDAHVEAPTAGSVILAGVMLKMGTYGFLRFALPLFPDQAKENAWLFITLAVIGIVYGAVVATVQPDMKKLVAYSSVSHLGFVMLGIFSFTSLGITGAVLQMINHGVSTGMLFFLVGMLYERKHTREIVAYGGIKKVVPVLSAFFMIAMLSSVALPLTNGFVGEFTILQGAYVSDFAGSMWTGIAATGMVLSAIYMLWMFQRVFTGPITHESNNHLADLTFREKAILVPLVVMVFWFGCYVTTWTTYLTKSVKSLQKGIGLQGLDPVEERIYKTKHAMPKVDRPGVKNDTIH